MSWTSAYKKAAKAVAPKPTTPTAKPVEVEQVDWDRLVSLDFETFYDTHYTLSKLSTSEYVRDPRFQALMVGIKIGRKKTKVVPLPKIKAELAKINWATHSVLCHNVQFDGFILSHVFGVFPKRYYCTLSMARGLHSNEIGAGLHDVSIHYGGQGKLDGLEDMKGIGFDELFANKPLWNKSALYCANDVDEMFRIFTEMVKIYPADEMDLIHMTARMFCAPVLRVDIPRVQAEYEREIARREELMLSVIDPRKYDDKTTLKKPAERALEGKERDMLIVKRVIGSNEKFADLLRQTNIREEAIPMKVSPAYIKKSAEEKANTLPEDKYTYAFAKDDLEFTGLPDRIWEISPDLDSNDVGHVIRADARALRLQQLIDVRIAVKSTTNVTRAERFLKAGKDGMPLPVGYAYYRAHTGRWGGNNKMNMQNLTRGGELRLSIMAAPGYAMAVADSGQIEARVNGWLWDQDDLIEAFRDKRDIYSEFASDVYGRTITKADKNDRHVGKVCIAEGELVLTHRGLVPINLISLEDWLWDGVEWVQHGGLIDQGIQEVITYDGLTATPDHEVFTECGRVLPLWQAASEMARLQRTGIEGRGLRFCDSHVIADTPRKRLSVRQGTMRPDWYYQADIAQQLEAREDNILPQEWAQADPTCGSSRAEIRRDLGAMQRPNPQELEELRWAGDQMSIQESDGVHPVGDTKPTTRELHPHGDRQDQQRRALRAGELEVSHQDPTEPEQTQYTDDPLARATSLDPRVPKSLQQELDIPATTQRANGRTNSRKVRVYDIANAGPRHRFTASGRLVLNCVLGLGYGMGAPKFQMTLAKGALGGPKIAISETEACRIVNLYRRKNYRIEAGWKMCSTWIEHMSNPDVDPIQYKCLTIGYQCIRLPNGMYLKYPDLRKARGDKGWDEWSYQSGDMRKKIYGSLLTENIVQALARIIVATQMLAIDKKYPIVMTTHDEAVAHPKLAQAQKCYDFMEKCMTTPPWWCPTLPLAAEGGFDTRYSK